MTRRFLPFSMGAVATIALILLNCREAPSNAPFSAELSKRSASDYFSGQDLQLALAVESDDPKLVAKSVSLGGSPTAVGREDISILMWALFKNKRQAFRALLTLGADPNYRSPTTGVYADGDSALNYAAMASDSFFLELLLQSGGNANLASNVRGETILGTAVKHRRFNNVRLLVEQGADINHRGLGGGTVLMDAAVQDDYEMVVHLLEIGAEPLIPNNRGQTVIELLRSYDDQLNPRSPERTRAIERLEGLQSQRK